MVTDRVPRSKGLLEEFKKSDRLMSLALPEDGRLVAFAKAIEEAMSSETRTLAGRACEAFLTAAADFYGVPRPTVRVLASRPVRVHESGIATELFGDYDPEERSRSQWWLCSIRPRSPSQ